MLAFEYAFRQVGFIGQLGTSAILVSARQNNGITEISDIKYAIA
ncbi:MULTISPECIES: hypothetical protein [unclassified Enterobacter]|nr:MULTISPECIES: hypothetical protein [unclassified Enterobacter]UXP21938.1 hypothetical protein N8O08_11485 [Enterobacter sp. 155105]